MFPFVNYSVYVTLLCQIMKPLFRAYGSVFASFLAISLPPTRLRRVTPTWLPALTSPPRWSPSGRDRKHSHWVTTMVAVIYKLPSVILILISLVHLPNAISVCMWPANILFFRDEFSNLVHIWWTLPVDYAGIVRYIRGRNSTTNRPHNISKQNGTKNDQLKQTKSCP